MIRIISFKVLNNQKIHFNYSDGIEKIINFTPFIAEDKLSKPLSDPAYFKKAALYENGPGIFFGLMTMIFVQISFAYICLASNKSSLKKIKELTLKQVLVDKTRWVTPCEKEQHLIKGCVGLPLFARYFISLPNTF